MCRNQSYVLQALAIVATLLALGCDRKTQPAQTSLSEREPAAQDAPTGDPRFLVAQPRVIDSPVPARFAGNIPTSLDGFRGDWSQRPPRSWIWWSLCAGDVEMHRRVANAIERAAERGPIGKELTKEYVDLYSFDYCPHKARCDRLADELRKPRQLAAEQVMWSAFSYCRNPAYQALIDGSRASDQAILDWYFQLFSKPTFSARAVRAAEAVAATREPWQVRKAGIVLGGMQDPRALAAVKRIQKQLGDAPGLAATVAIGLKYDKSPEAQRLFAAGCAHPDLDNEVMCRDDKPLFDSDDTDSQYTGLARMVRDVNFEPAEFLARESARRDELIAAYAQCARRPERPNEYKAQQCVSKLVQLDRDAAVAAMRAPDRGMTTDPYYNGMAEALARFPEPGSLERALRAWGMLGPTRTKTDRRDPEISARDMMEAFGRAVLFDTETGQIPNWHDSLLRDLAAMAAPALDDVMFEEMPPSREMPVYRLRAYMDGKRFEVYAYNYGDWYDVTRVIGLLNALLKARGSQLRFVSLPTTDQMAMVAVGPKPGLVAAHSAKLLQFSDVGEVRERGRELEDQLIEQLDKNGTPLERDVAVP